MGIHQSKLRFFSADGELIPTPAEAAQQEQKQRQKAEQQLAEMEAMLARYRERFGELPE